MKSKILKTGCLAIALVGTFGVSRTNVVRTAFDGAVDHEISTSSVVQKQDRVVGEPQDHSTSERKQRLVQADQAVTPAVVPEQPKVDESALRYFASKGDKIRLEAEIARLRSLYPDWVPPANPLAIPENEDKQLDAMWALYAQNKLPELRQAIAERRAREPQWTPPQDLENRLALAEKREKLIAASTARQYAEVVTIGAETPSLLTCGDVDVLWRVAEAFVKTDRPARANDAYSYILKTCTNTSERLATVQKAAALFDYNQMQALLGLEKTLPDGTPEFEPIRDDLARRFVAEGGKNADLVVAAPYLQRLERSTDKQGAASDALLLGWYHLKRKDMAAAEPLFRKAHSLEDTASASQGLALTLIARKEPLEAESVMYPWRESSADAKATYFAATANLMALDPPKVLDAPILRRVAEAANAAKEVKTSEQFGWYALAFHQPQTAAKWFRLVLGWKADYEPAAYGLAVARLQLKDMAGVRQIQNVWSERSARIAALTEKPKKATELNEIPVPDRVTVAKEADVEASVEETKRVEPVPRTDRTFTTRSIARSTGCRSTFDPAGMAPEAALSRGWCLMNLRRPLEAASAFEVALRSPSAKTREDAAYGQSLAYLRAGLVNDAAVAATKSRLGLKRAVELQTAILSDRAITAFNASRYRETLLYLDQLAQLRTERSDLLVLRAFAYQNLNRPVDARRIFEALAATGNRDAIRALAEIKSTSPGN